MNLKIKQRSLILKQVLVFVLLSPLYLIALQALSSGYSPFSPILLFNFLKTKFLILPLFMLGAWGVWHARSWSGQFLVFFVIVMSLVQGAIYLSYQDKVVLFLVFFYLLIALGTVMIWLIELSKVVYHPGFHHLDLGKKSAYPISVEFSLLPHAPDKKYKGYLSNWDIANCFIVPEESLVLPEQNVIVEFKVLYEDYLFEGRGELISTYGDALGISLLKDIASPYDIPRWVDFYDIMSERAIIHSL